jgi:hypothetical protein
MTVKLSKVNLTDQKMVFTDLENVVTMKEPAEKRTYVVKTGSCQQNCCVPHQKVLYKHSNHDRFSCSRHCNGRELAQ